VRNIRLVLAYDGTSYAGWQRQKQDVTIQGVVEQAIFTMTRSAAVLHGAGRTDAGVHALGMVANFLTDCSIPSQSFLKGLNGILPDDIRILAASDAPVDFHARRSARGKEYVYSFYAGEIMPPLERLYAAQVWGRLDLEAMRSCLPLIAGTHDFSSFEAAGSRDRTVEGGMGAVRSIFRAEILRDDQRQGFFRIIIAGNGFLRHMVRNIAGTLFEVGKGRYTPGDFAGILAARDRTRAGPTAPARGLLLREVFY
jgi:tRNA pseudouridine38-40 synthase